MFFIFMKVVATTLMIYGFFCVWEHLIKSSQYKFSCKQIQHIIFVENSEDLIENYLLNYLNETIIVIDNDSKDETGEILKKIEKSHSNIKVFDKKEGKKIVDKLFI